MRAQVCNARWGNGAAEAEARPVPAAGVSTFFRLRQDHLGAPAVLPPVPWTRLTIATLRAHAARPLLNGFRSTYAITGLYSILHERQRMAHARDGRGLRRCEAACRRDRKSTRLNS